MHVELFTLLKSWILVKHGQSFKKRFGCITVFFCAKYTLPGFLQVSESFFLIVALHDAVKGGTPYMGISPGRVCLCTHRPEREQERAHQHATFGSAARDSLGKNVSKEVCFWL